MSDKHAMRDWPLKRYNFPMPIRYHLSAPHPPGVVICFHGYQDHALSMIRRLGWWEVALPFQVLAINGPFPAPVWADGGFKEAYSWYFRDTSGELDFVSPTVTADRLRLLIHDLGLNQTPKVLFGFSMGGFLCPYVAAQVPNVRGIVGLGCGYVPEVYSACPPLALQAVHGQNDERIAFAPARADFGRSLATGHHGEFHLIPGLTHRVESSVEPLIRKLVLSCFGS